MKYRHELKHEISYFDMLILRSRLSAVAKRDGHTINGKYFIRSLYFDTPGDKALREKVDGVNVREKFRIRYYNLDTSVIHLEKKCKINSLCVKESVLITKQQAQMLSEGNFSWMSNSKEPLILEFYTKIMTQGLRAKTIVDYTREPFVFPAGNVRVTLDYNIRTALTSTDFLNPKCVTVPAGEKSIILEVKWDEFLPDIIKDAISLEDCTAGAFSKYAVCRTYG